MPASADTSYYRAPQPLMWTTGSANAPHGYDDRRHGGASGSRTSSQGARRSGHGHGAQSHTNASHNGYRSHGAASGSSSAYSQPSPSSSSVTSNSSSLRTPPDLLLNGSTAVPLAINKGFASGKGLHGSAANSVRHLSITQVEDRLKLLGRLSKAQITSDLPSPPASPRLQPSSTQLERQVSRKRKAHVNEAHDAPSPAGGKTPQSARKPRRRSPSPHSDEAMASPDSSDAKRSAKRSRDSSGRSRSDSDELMRSHDDGKQIGLPREHAWTRERYFDTAAAYRARGRELKHNGDRRMRDASTGVSSSSPRGDMLVAALEQTDALLLYTYGFWCEDQGSGNTVSNNWASLFGLLKYVKACHDRNKLTILSGLCRLLEANVLWHLATHEMRRVQRRMSLAASAAAGSPSASDSASMSDGNGKKMAEEVALPTSGAAATSSATIVELSQAMAKALGEQERSTRLYAQARQSVLSLAALSTSFPSLAKQCKGMQSNAAWIAADQADLAMRLDPSANAASPEASWTWPIDTSTPFPMLVCFGRALLREAGLEHGVAFTTEPIIVSALKR